MFDYILRFSQWWPANDAVCTNVTTQPYRRCRQSRRIESEAWLFDDEKLLITVSFTSAFKSFWPGEVKLLNKQSTLLELE